MCAFNDGNKDWEPSRYLFSLFLSHLIRDKESFLAYLLSIKALTLFLFLPFLHPSCILKCIFSLVYILTFLIFHHSPKDIHVISALTYS